MVDGAFEEKFHHQILYMNKKYCFSLILRHGRLDFICYNEVTKWAWVRGLTMLVAKLSNLAHRFQSPEE